MLPTLTTTLISIEPAGDGLEQRERAASAEYIAVYKYIGLRGRRRQKGFEVNWGLA